MYFDERKALKQQPSTKTQNRDRLISASPNQRHDRRIEDHGSRPGGRLTKNDEWQAAKMLDSANNKLQELMQLLYLLSRDPGVPQDARYHVTMAQSEIALLAHVMRNSQLPEGGEASSEGKAPHAACP
jgi:hypothetical protein